MDSEVHSPYQIQKSPMQLFPPSPYKSPTSSPLESQLLSPLQSELSSSTLQTKMQSQKQFKRKFTPKLAQNMKTQRSMTNIESTVSKLENIAAVAASSKAAESPFDVFGKSIAAQLKQLPKRQAIATQLKLQTILTEELLFHEDQLQTEQFNSYSNSRQSELTSFQGPGVFQSSNQYSVPPSTPSIEAPSSMQSIYTTDSLVDTDHTVSDEYQVNLLI